MITDDENLDDKIKEYLEYAGNLSTADEVRTLLNEKAYEVLKKIMMTRLTFGTAGLRGKMGPGYAAMNDLVIIQTSQGLAAYLEKCIAEGLGFSKQKAVVIGFDNRHNSKRFAHLTAVAFLLKNFKVYLFPNIVPTPFVPFTVKKFDCFAGIMITASHNPKDDNGYKVYWKNGAQISTPHDKNIQDSILKNLKPWPNSTDTLLVLASTLCYDPLPEIELSYYSEVVKTMQYSYLFSTSSLKITFTAMHGVSHSYMKKVFQKLKFRNYIPVREQMYPDPDFPTVKFPNPEEKNCLDLAIATADQNGSRLILANDPDADRLAIAEKLQSGNWHIYTGNEIGALLGFWMWYTAHHSCKKQPGNCCMISSTVSSKILRSIAKKEGFMFYETLTGFKWMANKAYDCMARGTNFLFAFEEAIGYMCGSTVLDKDGIQAAMHIAEMAIHADALKKRVFDLLRETYLNYGYHVSCNSYFICHDPAAIEDMFENLRNYRNSNKYPESLGDDLVSFPVKSVRDLTTGYDSSQPDKKAVLPTSKSTQMITFYFENGCEATLRTSGTEPKIKYYTEIIAFEPESNWKQVDELLHKVVDMIIKYWIQPQTYGFLNRP